VEGGGVSKDFRPGFTGAAIDRADNLRLAAERIRELASGVEARLMRLAGIEPMLDEAGRLDWAATTDLRDEEDLIFLGLAGETPLFAPMAKVDPDSSRTPSMFQLIGMMAPEDAALWGTVKSLLEWHSRHGFCSNCGSATVPFRAGWGRTCRGCGAEHFPRVDPVAIMLAEHRGRVLVGRQPRFPPRSFSALAGFIEPGESIEEAVARELKEEAGVVVSNVRYLASQPWPFPGSLMIACIAQAEGDALTIDTEELEDAMWVDREAVGKALARSDDATFLPPPPYAIAHTLFTRWYHGA
jgi:NAD+ diphosphatase